MITKIKFNSSLSIPMKRRVIQTSRDSTTHLGVPGATSSHLGGEFPRVTNAIKVVDEDAEVLLLGIKWLTQRLAQIFSLGLKDE
jgi:hypothetical protein